MRKLSLEQEVGNAITLLEKLRWHACMYDMHYGLICEHCWKWKAAIVVGNDEPITQFHDWTESYDSPIEAVKAAMKLELATLRDIIDERYHSYPVEQRKNCRQLRRAILATLPRA